MPETEDKKKKPVEQQPSQEPKDDNPNIGPCGQECLEYVINCFACLDCEWNEESEYDGEEYDYY